MKKIIGKSIKKIEIAAFLSVALFGLNFLPAAAQETHRARTVTAAPNPASTPVPQQTPPLAPTPAAIQTLPELQAKIRLILARPELQRGRIGLKIASLDTNKVLFEESAEKYFMPASNMKIYTIATALAKLSPNFRFATSVYANAMPDSNGTIRGDLTVYGRGDPSISTAFNDGDYYRGMDALAQKIAAAGVKRIEGNLVGDESYFNSDAIPSTWEWDDLQWYYGAEVSALTVNDNALDLTVRPGAGAGAAASVSISPDAYGLILVNRVTTAPPGAKREITVYRKNGSNVLEVSGTIPANGEKYQSAVAAVRPANVFVSILRRLLEQKGVTITGQSRVVNYREKAASGIVSALPPVEIAHLESAPLSLIAAKTLKPSQNLYTELILRALGEQVGDKSDAKKSSEQRGLEVVQNFLNEAGIAPGSIVQIDGCGLSRHDLITPASAVQLYSFMSRHQFAQSWRDAQPVGGIDGTLRARFAATAAANNVRAKTGTIDQVSSLSGYVTTASGERLAFSALTNNLPEGRLRTATIDEIVLLLANFNGKTN